MSSSRQAIEQIRVGGDDLDGPDRLGDDLGPDAVTRQHHHVDLAHTHLRHRTLTRT